MYSQNREDEVILKYFGGFKGALLDVGANDGKTFSNSLALIEKGWYAHLFEPSSAYRQLQQLHLENPKVKIYKKGLAAHTTTAILHESGEHVRGAGDSCLVSTCKEIDKKWRSVQFTDVEIELISFWDWYEYELQPELHFISIDCEGMDIEVMQQINLAQADCRLLCIEYNSIDADYQTIKSYCKQYGLKKELTKNAENVIFAL